MLALAIGANTAMFSVLNALLFRPLSVPVAGAVALLWTEDPNQNLREAERPTGTSKQWRSQSQSFATWLSPDGVKVTLTMRIGRRDQRRQALSESAPCWACSPCHGRHLLRREADQRQHVARSVIASGKRISEGSFDAIGGPLSLTALVRALSVSFPRISI